MIRQSLLGESVQLGRANVEFYLAIPDQLHELRELFARQGLKELRDLAKR